MTLSAHQPCYLPWLGWFNKLYVADCFVILDNVQFEKGSYTNRTRVKTADGARWLTIPIIQNFGQPINDVKMNGDQWIWKHEKTIQQNYHKTEYYYKELQSSWTFGADHFSLADFLENDLIYWLSPFAIETPIFKASEIVTYRKKQDLIIELCKHFKADTFLFGAQGRGYVEVEKFRKAGITCLFQDFSSFEYKQMYGDFIPGLSVIDALFNCGPEKTKELIVEGFKI